MKQSHYDPKKHEGQQPIRVLSDNIIHWFENTYLDFKDEIIHEINHNGLQKGVSYIIGEERISEVAYVGVDKEITIKE